MADTPSGGLMPPRRQSMRIAQGKSISPLPSLSSSLGATPEPSRLPTPVEPINTAHIDTSFKSNEHLPTVPDNNVTQRRSTRSRRPPQRFVCDVGEVFEPESANIAHVPRKRDRAAAREAPPKPKHISVKNKVHEAVKRGHRPRKPVHIRVDAFKKHNVACYKRVKAANKRRIKDLIRKAAEGADAAEDAIATAASTEEAEACVKDAIAWVREQTKLRQELAQFRNKKMAADAGKAAARAWPPKPNPLYGWSSLPPYPTPPPEAHWQLKKVVASGPNQTPREFRPCKSPKGPWYQVGDDVNGYSTFAAKSQLGALAAQKYQITPAMIHDVMFNSYRRQPTEAEQLAEVLRTASFPYQNLMSPTRLKMGPITVTAKGPAMVSYESGDKMDVDEPDDSMDVDEPEGSTPAHPKDPLRVLAAAAQEVERLAENPTMNPLTTLSIAAREVERNAEVRELELLRKAYEIVNEPPIRPTRNPVRYWQTLSERSTSSKKTGQ